MPALPPFDNASLFDEAGYLRLYPDIASALMRGVLDTGWNHFIRRGRAEGRRPNDVDSIFYLASYPQMEHDLGHTPTVADAAPHFITLGRARGYRANAGAPRALNGAAQTSPFGGFWTDQANALDLVQGRLDLGRISRREAAMLRTFALDGIVELEGPFDQKQVRDAALVVDQAFTGMFRDLRIAAAAHADEPEPWRPVLTGQNVAALDLHMLSGKIRSLLLDKAVTAFLSLLFESRPRLTASRAVLRDAAPPERDIAWHAHTLPMQFVAVIFALESTDEGPAFAWPGSHRLPDLPWDRAHVTLEEARRIGARDLERDVVLREGHVRTLLHDQEPRRLASTAGLRMVRHANLVHAVAAPTWAAQRRSLTAWYCPFHVAPCYVETARVRSHVQDECIFSSGVYPALDPLD